MIDINKILPDQVKTDMPKFNPGDHIRVQVRVIEGDKERLQSFEGDVISVRGSGVNRTFTVRKMSSGVGVERIFPFNSPKIAKVEVLKQGDERIFPFNSLLKLLRLNCLKKVMLEKQNFSISEIFLVKLPELKAKRFKLKFILSRLLSGFFVYEN